MTSASSPWSPAHSYGTSKLFAIVLASSRRRSLDFLVGCPWILVKGWARIASTTALCADNAVDTFITSLELDWCLFLDSDDHRLL